MGDVDIHGICDERFASVREAFEENFKRDLELGAAFAVALEGELVVDLWGGYADVARSRPWQEDTLVGVSSTAKIANTLCGLMLVDRGLIDLEHEIVGVYFEAVLNETKDGELLWKCDLFENAVNAAIEMD